MKSVVCYKEKKFISKNTLSDDEYNILKDHLKPLNNLFHELNFIYDLKSCFNDLNSLVIKFTSGEISNQILQKDLNKQIVNYLGFIRTFLDKWEKHIKENFGKDSKELELLKNLTHDEYDKNFHYRFLSNLCNYSRHTGYSFHKLSTSLNYEDKRILKTLVNKNIFLNGFNWKKSFFNEINSLSQDDIDIYPFLKDMFISLEKIHFKLVKFNIITDINKLTINSLYLINFLNKIKDCDGEVLITEFIGDIEEFKSGSNNLEMNIEHLPLKIALFVIKTYLKAHKNFIKIFNFDGNYLGKLKNSFPIKNNDGFFEGSEIVYFENKKWIILLSELHVTPSKIEFFTTYEISGFPSSHYETDSELIKSLRVSKFNNLLNIFK